MILPRVCRWLAFGRKYGRVCARSSSAAERVRFLRAVVIADRDARVVIRFLLCAGACLFFGMQLIFEHR